MARTFPFVLLAACIAGSQASAAAPLAATATPKEAAQPDTDFALPPPHGSPKELATGGTRGLAIRAAPQARSVLDMHPADAEATPPRPRSLTGTRP